MRIDKFLSETGFGSRTEIKKLIKSGAVTVLGREKIRPEDKIDPYCDKIFVFGKTVSYQKYVYIMMNKPKGYISATFDKKQRTVTELLPKELLHFKPFVAGRLDIDTEGLLLLTNDGDLTHKILSPKNHIPKTYFAKISGELPIDAAEKFACGVDIGEDKPTAPAALEILSRGELSEINLTITEGKFHQVKRMFEAIGCRVVYLKRIKMNALSLDESLKIGECRELSEAETALLKEGI